MMVRACINMSLKDINSSEVFWASAIQVCPVEALHAANPMATRLRMGCGMNAGPGSPAALLFKI